MLCYIGSDNMDRARGGLHGNHNVLNIFFEILARIPRILLDPRMDEDVFELFLFFFCLLINKMSTHNIDRLTYYVLVEK